MKIFDHTINAPTKIDRHDKTSVLSVPSVVDTYQYSYRVNIYSGSESAWTLEKQTTFTYDGWNLIQEVKASVYDSNNSAFTQLRTSNYTWGLDLSQTTQGAGGVGGLLSLSIPNSEFVINNYYYTYDGNGNVSELISESGEVAAHYEYSPFGKVVYKTGPMKDENPIQFSTKYMDNETGLLYYSLRYYNPENGRWINRDPIEELGGSNVYVILHNDSINQTDLLGLADTIGGNPIMGPGSYIRPGGGSSTGDQRPAKYRLVFDGKQICKLSIDLKECSKCWEAVSGKDLDRNGKWDDTSEEDQRKSEGGTIPEGNYYFPTKKVRDPSKDGNWDTDDWNNYEKSDGDGWKRWKTNVNHRSKKGWGDRFGRLRPWPGNPTKRTNFNIHGGDDKGSAGCIDIGCNDKDFFRDARKMNNRRIQLTVDYSGKSTKNCKKCKDRKEDAWPKEKK